MYANSGVEKTWKEISTLMARIFLELGFIPSEIRIKSQRLHDALGGLTPELKIELKRVSLLRRLDAARTSLQQCISRGEVGKTPYFRIGATG